TLKQLNDINLRLNQLSNTLPDGAGPIQFNSNFGDTAALMLTVASPPVSETDIALRARSVKKAIGQLRATLPKSAPKPRVSIVVSFPRSVAPEALRLSFRLIEQAALRDGIFADVHLLEGPGFIGFDVSTQLDDASLRAWGQRFVQQHFHHSEIHP